MGQAQWRRERTEVVLCWFLLNIRGQSFNVSFNAYTEECNDNSVEESALEGSSLSDWSTSGASHGSSSSSDSILLILESTKARKKRLIEGPPGSNSARNIDQDFTMLFGEEVSGKFLAKWPTFFKLRIIAECKNLPLSVHLDELLLSDQQESDDGVWDCEVAAIFLLLYLLPPTSKGKKSAKISAKEAADRLMK
ncbi:hypothetical protein PFLUV_G00067660 [Perca fluviatilis]|uniref:Uncharacterized protein n=1 Tax=Perca fluviatilis TaxID=8168 RepID=A0A6A5F9W0_PERFL|nr:hypothetical protein PFLUV_G00067660 [Perca fluviatilis]